MSFPPTPDPAAPSARSGSHQPGVSRRTSRRALLAAGAWTAPVVVIATAAPTFAASPCLTDSPYLLDWGSVLTPLTQVTAGVAAYVRVPSVTTGDVYVHFSTTANAANAIDTARNLTLPPNTGTGTTQDPVVTDLGDLGGTIGGERGIRLQHNNRAAGAANAQVLTISFRDGPSAASPLRSVQGLTFSVTDIDSLTGQFAYSDRVSLSGTRTYVADTNVTANVAGGGTATVSVLGAGTDADPWRLCLVNTTTDANVNIDENSAGARVRVSYPGAVTSITLKYWSQTTASIYHRRFLSDFGFAARPSGC